VFDHPLTLDYIFIKERIDTDSPEFQKIARIIRHCVTELLNKILFEVLEGQVDMNLLYTICVACISIAIKLFGAHDWIYPHNIYLVLITLAQEKLQAIDAKTLSILEADILARTDWRACQSVAGLHKIYDDLFNEESHTDSQLSREDMKEMIQQSQQYRKSLQASRKSSSKTLRLSSKSPSASDSELTEGTVIYKNGTWYLYTGLSKLSANDVRKRNVQNPKIWIPGFLLDDIMQDGQMSMGDAIQWIRDNVLTQAFGIGEHSVHLNYSISREMF
jgi:hypothetical protein